MAKKKAIKVVSEEIAEVSTPVVEKKEESFKSEQEEMIQALMVKFEGNRQLAEKRLRYLKQVSPPPENDKELWVLVKRYISGLPLSINEDKSETKFSPVI